MVARGKSALMAQPGIVKGLKSVLYDESLEVHIETARCLGMLYEHNPGSCPSPLFSFTLAW